MEGSMTISIGSQIAEVERELRMRAKVYPRMAYGPGHTFARRSEADLATQIMEAVLETLKWNRDRRAEIIEWIKNRKKPEAA